MQTIKFYCHRLVIVLWVVLAVPILDSASAKAKLLHNFDTRTLAGDIVLQNLLPEVPAVTWRVKKTTIDEKKLALQGDILIADESHGKDTRLGSLDINVNTIPDSPQKQFTIVADIDSHSIGKLWTPLQPIIKKLDDYALGSRFYRLKITFDGEWKDITERRSIDINFAASAKNATITPLFTGSLTTQAGWAGIDALQAKSEPTKVNVLAPLLESFIADSIPDAKLDLQGQLTSEIAFDGNEKISIAMHADSLNFTSDEIFKTTQNISKFNLKASYDLAHKSLNLKDSSFTLDQARFALNGEIKTSAEQTQKPKFNFHATFRKISGNYQIQNLKNNWPLTLARNAREWVTQNIKSASVKKANLKIQGQFQPNTNQPLKIKYLRTDLQVTHGEFTYWHKLPSVSVDNTHISLTDKDLNISTSTASTDKLKNVSAELHIPLSEINADGFQVVAIKFYLNHNFLPILALLNHPNLQLLKEWETLIKINSATFQGEVNLQLPLSKDLEKEDVAFAVTGALKRIKIPNLLPEIRANADKLKIGANNDEIHISAEQIILNGIATQLDSRIYLKSESPYKGRHILQFTLDDRRPQQNQYNNIDQLFNRYVGRYIGENYASEHFFDGRITAQLEITQKHDDNIQIDLDANLNEAELNIRPLVLQKPPDVPARLHITARYDAPILIVDNATYNDSTNHLDLWLSANFNAENILRELEVRKLQTPQQKLSATIKIADIANATTKAKIQKYQAHINAESLNLTHLLNHFADAEHKPENDIPQQNGKKTPEQKPPEQKPLEQKPLEQDTPPKQDIPPFELTLMAQHISTDDNPEAMKNLNLATVYDGDKVKRFEFVAQLNDTNAYLNYRNTHKEKKLQSDIPQLGQLLSHLGLSRRVRDGHLKISAAAANPNEALFGEFSITEFRLRKAFILGRLLQVASITDAHNALLQKGIKFKSWNGRFTYDDKLLTLVEGKLHGRSIGLTMEGNVNGHTNTLNLQGTLIPAYWINALIYSIPLVGNIVTGKNDDALFAFRYGIEGDVKNPDISVNLVSGVTPKIVRQIFFNVDNYEDYENDTTNNTNRKDR